MKPLLCPYCICIEKEQPLRSFLLLAYNLFHIIAFSIKIIKLLHLYTLCSNRIIKIINKKLPNLSNFMRVWHWVGIWITKVNHWGRWYCFMTRWTAWGEYRKSWSRLQLLIVLVYPSVAVTKHQNPKWLMEEIVHFGLWFQMLSPSWQRRHSSTQPQE